MNKLYTAITSSTVEDCIKNNTTQLLLDCNNGWGKTEDSVKEWIKNNGRNGQEYAVISVSFDVIETLTVRHNPTLERK